MDEIRNSELFQMDTDDPDKLVALFNNILLPLSIRILLVDHELHE